MKNWNPDFNTTHNAPIEQRSSSIDRSRAPAEAQRIGTKLDPSSNIQSSEVGWSPVSRKQNDDAVPKKVHGFDMFHLNAEKHEQSMNKNTKRNTFGPNSRIDDMQIINSTKESESSTPFSSSEMRRQSAPHAEPLQFFEDPNTLDTENNPSRSALDKGDFHHEAISNLPPYAGDRTRRSSAPNRDQKGVSIPSHRRSSALSGPDSFLRQEELAPGNGPVSPRDNKPYIPSETDNQASDREPIGSVDDDKEMQQFAGSRLTPVQESKEFIQDQQSEKDVDKNKETSYSKLATGAVASVAATATAAAAVLFGSSHDNDKDKTDEPTQDSDSKPAGFRQNKMSSVDDQLTVNKECISCGRVKDTVNDDQKLCSQCQKSSEHTPKESKLDSTGFTDTPAAVKSMPGTASTEPVSADRTARSVPAGIENNKLRNEWIGLDTGIPQLDGVLVADKNCYGINKAVDDESKRAQSKPAIIENKNESFSSTRAINGEASSEEGEMKQAHEPVTQRKMENTAEKQRRRSSFASGFKSKAAAGGAAVTSAFRRFSHGSLPSSGSEQRRISDAEAYKRQQSGMAGFKKDQQRSEYKHITNPSGVTAEPQHKMSDHNTASDFADRQDPSYGQQNLHNSGHDEPYNNIGGISYQTSSNTPYDNKDVANNNRLTTDMNHHTETPSSFDHASGIATDESMSSQQKNDLVSNKVINTGPDYNPMFLSADNATNLPSNKDNTMGIVNDHAFGNPKSAQVPTNAAVHPTDDIGQNYSGIPGIESMRPEGTAENQDKFIKENENNTRRKSRKGSIQKVFDKLFHKNSSKA